MATQQRMQDAILLAIVDTAQKWTERGDCALANAIREEGCRIAKRWRISSVPGLPGTYPDGARKIHVMRREG